MNTSVIVNEALTLQKIVSEQMSKNNTMHEKIDVIIKSIISSFTIESHDFLRFLFPAISRNILILLYKCE